MQLIDGLTIFHNRRIYGRTCQLEEEGAEILKLIEQYRDEIPPEDVLTRVYKFMIAVERWKLGGGGKKYARDNGKEAIWNALVDAVNAANAQNDDLALQAIMRLKGFGSGKSQRAKVASAPLRFLMPDRFGVVDWRIAVVLELFGEYKGDVDRLEAAAREMTAVSCRKAHNLIGSARACGLIQQYRQIKEQMGFDRVADVDMALFGLSTRIWRLPNCA